MATLEPGNTGPMSGGQAVTLAEQGSLNQSLVEQWVYGMRVIGLTSDKRCQGLAQCQSFFDGTQHDHLGQTWNGVPRDPGVGYMWERLQPQGFVPVNSSMWLDARKPDAPVPMARQVVSRFTEMLLGEGRTPVIRVFSDQATQDYLEACFKEADLWDVLAEARDLAGSCGSAAIAMGVTNRHLSAEVLNPKDLWIPQWSDVSPTWSPDYVVEQYIIEKQSIDPDNGEMEMRTHWRTRAWTPTHVVYYHDVPCEEAEETGIPVREAVEHHLGSCPVVWYQNTRSTKHADGRADCDTAWPLLDKLDRLQSQVYKAAIANADPTLVIREDRAQRRNDTRTIQKGSNHVISLSSKGQADYLEIEGSSVKAGLEAIDKLVREILTTVECVVVDPEYARAYQSGEALQLLWRSMESRANRLRVTLGAAVKSMCYFLMKIAQTHGVSNIEESADDSTGRLLLPPRRLPTVPNEVLQKTPMSNPLEAGPGYLAPPPNKAWGAHTPGNINAFVELDWPSYWTPTPQQIQHVATAMATSTTSKPVLSQETATRKMAEILNVDAEEEVRKMGEENQQGLADMINLGTMEEELDRDSGYGDQSDDLAELESEEGAPKPSDVTKGDADAMKDVGVYTPKDKGVDLP